MNNLIGRSGGFDLSSSKARRKSLAASAFGEDSKGESLSHCIRLCALADFRCLGTKKDRAPPSFADRVVAGACQLLMHDLYRNVRMTLRGGPVRSSADQSFVLQDQRLLLENMQESQGEYQYVDEFINSGEVPAIFRDWSTASDDEKIKLKVRSWRDSGSRVDAITHDFTLCTESIRADQVVPPRKGTSRMESDPKREHGSNRQRDGAATRRIAACTNIF